MILEAGLVYLTICVVIAFITARENPLSAGLFLISGWAGLFTVFLIAASLDAILTNTLGLVALGMIGLLLAFWAGLAAAATFIGGWVVL